MSQEFTTLMHQEEVEGHVFYPLEVLIDKDDIIRVKTHGNSHIGFTHAEIDALYEFSKKILK
jgi:hypothetical protein